MAGIIQARAMENMVGVAVANYVVERDLRMPLM